MISKLLKMSESLAGVTLLAMGNGFPDLVASIPQYKGDTELMYTELLGAAIFVTGLTAGVVILIKPFEIVARNYIRDVVAFLLALALINQFMADDGYALWEGLVTVMVYLGYLAYVFIDHGCVKRQLEQLRKLSKAKLDEVNLVDLQSQVEILEETVEIQIKRKDSSVILDEEILKVFRTQSTDDPNTGLFKTFKQAICPFSLEKWNSCGYFMRTILILKVN